MLAAGAAFESGKLIFRQARQLRFDPEIDLGAREQKQASLSLSVPIAVML